MINRMTRDTTYVSDGSPTSSTNPFHFVLTVKNRGSLSTGLRSSSILPVYLLTSIEGGKVSGFKLRTVQAD